MLHSLQQRKCMFTTQRTWLDSASESTWIELDSRIRCGVREGTEQRTKTGVQHEVSSATEAGERRPAGGGGRRGGAVGAAGQRRAGGSGRAAAMLLGAALMLFLPRRGRKRGFKLLYVDKTLL